MTLEDVHALLGGTSDQLDWGSSIVFGTKLVRPGRREKLFLREVGIIIVGVLIALALEQLASNWRDRQRVSDIRAAMHEELEEFSQVLAVRVASQPCIVSKLEGIERALDSEKGGAPLTNVGRPPFFFSGMGAWNSGASDLLSRHIGPTALARYAQDYDSAREFLELAKKEQDLWATLQTLEHQEELIAGERRWRLVEAASGARNANLLLNAIAAQTLQVLEENESVARNRAFVDSVLSSTTICNPSQEQPAPPA